MIGRLWERLSRPWSRGMIIVVTAVVTATAVVLITRAQYDVDEPRPLAEESWVEEQLTELEPPPADSPLADVDIPIPDGVEPVETLTWFEPRSSWRPELTALPAGRYAVHAGCGFVEPLLEEDGGRVMVNLGHGEAGDDGPHGFSVECGGELAPVDHELVFGTATAVSVSGVLSRFEVEVMESDELSVRVDGELLNAAYVAVIAFVPVTG